MKNLKKSFSKFGGNFYVYSSLDEYARMCWYILRVDDKKLPLFKKISSELVLFNLSDYGTIIESGFGQNPPEEILKKYFNSVS